MSYERDEILLEEYLLEKFNTKYFLKSYNKNTIKRYLSKEDKTFIDTCKSIVSLFSEYTEHMRIKETIYYLQNFYNDKKYDINVIENLMLISDNYSQIFKMYAYLDLIQIYIYKKVDNYELPLYIAYLFDKSNKSNFFNISINKIDNLPIIEKAEISQKLYTIFKENLNTYLIHLYKTIFIHVIRQ